MTLEEALRFLAPFAREEGFDTIGVREKLDSDKAIDSAISVLRDALIVGQLTPSLWRSVTSAREPDDFIPAMGRLWDELVKLGVAETAEGMPDNWSHETLRLWAYTNEWLLLSQDEDLMLMEEGFIAGLLEIAAEPGCPKREYILQIVSHSARDAAFEAIGSDSFRNLMTRIAQHESLARKAGASELADYLKRLGSYAVPKTVDREGAHQRGLDLTRCHEPEPQSVVVERDRKYWVVVLPGHVPTTIRIAQTDGRIR